MLRLCEGCALEAIMSPSSALFECGYQRLCEAKRCECCRREHTCEYLFTKVDQKLVNEMEML